MSSQTIEERTQFWGAEIFARVKPPQPFPLSPAWFDARIMAATMASPDLKVQLFRFVDVLPMLQNPREIRRHLAEYLSEAGDFSTLGALSRWIPIWGPIGSIFQAVTRWSAQRMARRFIVGSTLDGALGNILTLRKGGYAFTVDVLGESTLTEEEGNEATREYIRLIEKLGPEMAKVAPDPLLDTDLYGPIPRANVSVKLSALCPTFDAVDVEGTTRAILPLVRQILRSARDHGVFVNFDMEQFAYKNLVLHIVETVLTEKEFRDGPACGIAIQAYLRETGSDLIRLKNWAEANDHPITVRLVKGAYWDFETIHSGQMGWPNPVWEIKDETDLNYELLSSYLIEQRRWLRPAFASHNVRSLGHAVALAEKEGLSPGAIEFQSLYGMGEPIQHALKGIGQRVRVYAPYGELLPGMAYLVRRLLENTANDSFLRQSLAEHQEQSVLLASPSARLAVKAKAQSNQASPSTQESTYLGEPSMPSGLNPTTTPAPIAPEPFVDFTLAENREKMVKALAQVREQLGKKYPSVINGKSIETGNFIRSLNPSRRSECVGEVHACGVAEADLAVKSCLAFQDQWAQTPVAHRAGALRKAANIMEARRYELSAWMVLEVGKSWREADADVAEAVDFCRYYADQMEWLAQPLGRDVPGEGNLTLREAKGVALVIAPWNFPLAILCGMTTASLVAGCCTIMKPAEQSPIIATLLHGILLEAGIPAAALALVHGQGEEVGAHLVNHPDVALIAFTGSLKVGSIIYEQASKLRPGQKQFKRVLAEMGGKNALIIDDDADLDEAIRGVMASAFGFQGQKCSACSRVLVPRSLHDSFVERLAKATKTLTMGPSEDPTFALGPVIDDEARERMEGVIQAARKRGKDHLAWDAGELTRTGSYVAPAIFTGLSPDDPVATDEIFGPVLVVLPYDSFEEAIELANRTPFALTGGIYSRSPQRIEKARRQVRAGNFYINRKITGAIVDRQPFGGFGFSGIGAKAGGPDYLPQFLIQRTITENTMRRGFSPDTVKN